MIVNILYCLSKQLTHLVILLCLTNRNPNHPPTHSKPPKKKRINKPHASAMNLFKKVKRKQSWKQQAQTDIEKHGIQNDNRITIKEINSKQYAYGIEQ